MQIKLLYIEYIQSILFFNIFYNVFTNFDIFFIYNLL